ncbi:secreted protein [Thioploca ingrica]|uniref:Secreted protein n=1 Tax=Thioploca ingrica TaxID=40754 RepID=A0A090BW54_9GAMM|nr:secreted protein [Thioploca ingrica]
MNQKLFAFAIAATLVAPMAADADVKLSGVIQGEITSSQVGNGDEDRKTLTKDKEGAIFNSGPNLLTFDIDEKLGGGLAAYARYQGTFSTSDNAGITGKEAYLGLKTPSFFLRYGKLTGAYKSSYSLIDPWAATSLQARGTGGGMSGGRYNSVTWDATSNTFKTNATWDATNNTFKTGEAASTKDAGMGLSNSGYVEGALEAGMKMAGFTGRIQGVVDDNSDMNGAGLLELLYNAPGDTFTMWLSGAYTDLNLKDTAKDLGNSATGNSNASNDNGLGNWKIGGQFKLGPALTLGLQYEDAEIGTFDNNPDGGKYILGSVDFMMNNFSLAAWVGTYLSDIADNARLKDDQGNAIDEDALSWALGGKYLFSKRTMVYAGYRQTDSDNDYRDEDVFALGLKHSF